jgi:hypothetical protein
MSTQASRQVANVLREYGRDKLQAIGRADLIGGLNTPINNDDQLANAVGELQGTEADLVSTWIPAYDAYWAPAQAQVETDIPAAITVAGLDQEYSDMWADPDTNTTGFLKAMHRVIGRAVTINLHDIDNP